MNFAVVMKKKNRLELAPQEDKVWDIVLINMQ
jgi:hypothetical protein